jgi:hypothetical protein
MGLVLQKWEWTRRHNSCMFCRSLNTSINQYSRYFNTLTIVKLILLLPCYYCHNIDIDAYVNVQRDFVPIQPLTHVHVHTPCVPVGYLDECVCRSLPYGVD